MPAQPSQPGRITLRQPRAAWLGLLLAAASAGCFTSHAGSVCRRDPVTGLEQCQLASDHPADAASVTAAATGVYAVTGCTLNGCVLPDRCNTKTKRCEPLACGETKDCPAGYRCAMNTHTCR